MGEEGGLPSDSGAPRWLGVPPRTTPFLPRVLCACVRAHLLAQLQGKGREEWTKRCSLARQCGSLSPLAVFQCTVLFALTVRRGGIWWCTRAHYCARRCSVYCARSHPLTYMHYVYTAAVAADDVDQCTRPLTTWISAHGWGWWLLCAARAPALERAQQWPPVLSTALLCCAHLPPSLEWFAVQT